MKDFKVVKRIKLIMHPGLTDLEKEVNDFLETINPNDFPDTAIDISVTSPGQVYIAKIEYMSKLELEVKEKKKK